MKNPPPPGEGEVEAEKPPAATVRRITKRFSGVLDNDVHSC